MPINRTSRPRFRHGLAAVLISAAMATAPDAAPAQVVVVVNGSPVTALDIDQRTKLIHLSSPRRPSRQEVTKELVDEKLKVFIAKRYSVEVSDSDVESSFSSMASRGRLTTQQMAQQLSSAGSSAGNLKEKIRADLAWSRLIRGKFGQTLQVGEGEIAKEVQLRNVGEEAAVGYIYKLYPVLLFVARDAATPVVEAKRREAENLRSKFQSCSEGLVMTRAIRDTAVRDVMNRSSADLAPQLRETLASTPIGRLTTPERTQQGFQMFAVCDKQQSAADAPIKHTVREEMFVKRFEAEASKFLEEVRRSSMIEYR